MIDMIFKQKLCVLLVMKLTLAVSQITYGLEEIHGSIERKKHIHGIHKECPLPKDRNDIVDCALSFHPRVKRSTLEVDSATKLREKASQIPNPTLSTRYVKGDGNGEDTSEIETNLSFTLELGNKRHSRKEYAQAQKRHAEINKDAIKANVKVTTILNLYRLRQVLEEKQVLKEALAAFSKVIHQLKKLPRLSAEQEASLTLFEIALEETKVNESELFEEERKLEHYFHIATGHSLEEIKPFLPNTPKKWPSTDTAVKSDKSSPEVKKLKSLASLAERRLGIQNSKAWPDLKIGPSFALEKDGAAENKMIGFNIQVPISLFQVNGGGKAHAQSELLGAKKNISLVMAEENHERFEQVRVYESAVKTLKRTMKLSVIEKKHDRIEKLYLRGVISSSAFLNSLKQKFSYLISRNNREITAIRALWSIYKYDGKVFEEKL